MDKETKDLLPGETYNLLNGGRVVIRPVPFGRIPDFFDDIEALLKKFIEKSKIELLTDAGILLKVAFEETLKIAGRIINKKRAWFNTIDIADGIAIVNIILKQNIDNDRSKKNLRELLERAGSLLRTSSKPSSAPATDLKTSKDTHQGKSDSSPEVSPG